MRECRCVLMRKTMRGMKRDTSTILSSLMKLRQNRSHNRSQIKLRRRSAAHHSRSPRSAGRRSHTLRVSQEAVGLELYSGVGAQQLVLGRLGRTTSPASCPRPNPSLVKTTCLQGSQSCGGRLRCRRRASLDPSQTMVLRLTNARDRQRRHCR